MNAHPPRRLDTILECLENASEPADLQDISVQFRDYFGVDHLVYHWVSAAGDQYGCGTYHPDWVQRYLEKDYLRIDPVIQGCYQRFHPVDWKRLDWSGEAARAFLKEALDYGLRNQGYSVPLRGPNGQFALFTVNHRIGDDSWARFTRTHMQELLLAAHYVNERALALDGDSPAPHQALSPRETDALTLLAAGNSRAKAAERLKISEHTLRVYIESARFKLGAMNTTHAVANALSRGLICL